MPNFCLASRPVPRLSLVGRAIFLLLSELLANAVIWVVAGICFRGQDALLSLALLAWTIGLRHALDADHISAIDNATRQLVSQGQLPITCGLFFSLGHSTIVIAVNIAIAISVDIYDKLDTVGSVGGIVGTAISASFLFLIACINIFFLIQALRERRRVKNGQTLTAETDVMKIQGGGCLVRIIAPILKAVDRPWKMYPVGVLFGFGFDTASSIALLAISAVAQGGTDDQGVSHGKLVIFPLLFTAGMTMVDSLDSILMLYAYAQPELRPSGRFTLLEDDKGKCRAAISALPATRVQTPIHSQSQCHSRLLEQTQDQDNLTLTTQATLLNLPHSSQQVVGCDSKFDEEGEAEAIDPADIAGDDDENVRERENDNDTAMEIEMVNPRMKRVLANKAQTMSSLSISLTLLSILVALSISLIEIMGLIGDNCGSCQDAANDPEGGGLAGSWWRAWGAANDASGYIGAAIVGCFVALLICYQSARWGWKRYQKRKAKGNRLVLIDTVS